MGKYKIIQIDENKHLAFMKANTIATISYEMSKHSTKMRDIVEILRDGDPMDDEDYAWHSRKVAILQASIEKIQREWN